MVVVSRRVHGSDLAQRNSNTCETFTTIIKGHINLDIIVVK